MNRKVTVPETLFRSAQFDRAAINDEDRTVSLSISSEAPYKRYFGTEILDHKAECVDLKRMASGAPLLFNHDRNAHIGRIIEACLDNGKLDVKAKFGNSALANEKWQDVKDGILREASVGYQVTKMVLEEEKDDECTYRVTEWTPYEGSLVTIPADPNVGVGRMEATRELEISIKNEKPLDGNSQICESTTTKKTMATEATPQPAPDITVVRNEAVTAERKRVGAINELSEHFRTNGLAGRKIDTTDLANACIRDGKSVQDFQDAAVRGNFNEVSAKLDTMPELGMSNREVKQFSFTRAMRCLANKRPLEGLEKEASEAQAKLLGKDVEGIGFFIPEDVFNGRAYPGGFNRETNGQLRALFAGTYGAAGALVADDNSAFSLIELLRNQMLVVAMGARSLSGLRGNVPIPRQTGGATASWLNEDSTITATNQTVGQLTLTPHKLAAATAYTQQLLAQSSVDVENFVRQDLMAVIAIARDLAAIDGSGVSGQPLGIINTAGLSTNVTLAAVESLTYAKAVAFETNVALNNAIVGSKCGYLTSVGAKQNAKLLAEIASNNSTPVWKNDMVNGYTAKCTNQVPTANGVIFGNWDDLILASWGDNSVIVDPYSLSLQGQVRIVMQMHCDNGLRHAASFAKGVL